MLLVTHAMTGFTVASIGMFIALLTLITAPRHIPEILKKVDYKTLLFFTGLFVVVGGLEQTGILEIVAGFIGKISGGNVYLLVAIIIWVSAFAILPIRIVPPTSTMARIRVPMIVISAVLPCLLIRSSACRINDDIVLMAGQ